MIQIYFYRKVNQRLQKVHVQFVLAFTCPRGMIKCKDGLQCIRPSDRCDNRDDCNDNSDEDEDFCRGDIVILYGIYID